MSINIKLVNDIPQISTLLAMIANSAGQSSKPTLQYLLAKTTTMRGTKKPIL